MTTSASGSLLDSRSHDPDLPHGSVSAALAAGMLASRFPNPGTKPVTLPPLSARGPRALEPEISSRPLEIREGVDLPLGLPRLSLCDPLKVPTPGDLPGLLQFRGKTCGK